LVAAKSE